MSAQKKSNLNIGHSSKAAGRCDFCGQEYSNSLPMFSNTNADRFICAECVVELASYAMEQFLMDTSVDGMTPQ